MTTIRVDSPAASYDVIVGDVSASLDRMAALAGDRLLPLVSDARVHGLYGRHFQQICHPLPILVREGEAAKDWAGLSTVIERLTIMGVTRGTPIVALGGGSIGDVSGLAAALFKRGCPVIHVPTTLLAQADSAIGGKTAIDAGGQKNVAGVFHHPALVLVDPAFLVTLDDRHLRSGYAEVVKYGLINDAGFFLWCHANGKAVLAGDRDAIRFAVEHCIRAKAAFVAADPEDLTGRRALLNLGHTFAHAIESAAGIGALLHGEAVAVGITLAFRFSAALGLASPEDARTVRAHFANAGLPTDLADVGLRGQALRLAELMVQDKKADRNGLAMVLVKGIGQAAIVRSVEQPRLMTFLQEVD